MAKAYGRDMLKQRFSNATKRLGLNQWSHCILDMSEFRRPVIEAAKKPVAAPSPSPQLSLF